MRHVESLIGNNILALCPRLNSESSKKVYHTRIKGIEV